MNKQCDLERRYHVLNYLSTVPKRILSLSGTDNVTEFVLYDLCGENCFNLNKAAYFIDNPDFNCFKGVAGFLKEKAKQCEQRWDKPSTFNNFMRECSFNTKIRSIQRNSVRKTQASDEHIAEDLAQELGLSSYRFCTWNMKHDNHGLFIYEPVDKDDTVSDDYLVNGLYMLSFCPVF